MKKVFCKHGQREFHKIGVKQVYAQCLNCGTKSEVCKTQVSARASLRAIQGPLREYKRVEVGETTNMGRRMWTCAMYPESKLRLRELARALDFNGVMSRSMVALMSVPIDVLVKVVQEHGEKYQTMYDLSRERDMFDHFDGENDAPRRARIRAEKERDAGK